MHLFSRQQLAIIFAASCLLTLPVVGQSPTGTKVLAAPSTGFELLYSSSVRADGAAEVTLSFAGQNGLEIAQERSVRDRAIVSRTVLAPTASNSQLHLSQTKLILEKDPADNAVVLVLHPQLDPGRTIRLILPSEPVVRTGSISMGIINRKDPGDGTGGSGGGTGGGGCYPITYTSDRCGTIYNCCPTTSFTVDGIARTIICN